MPESTMRSEGDADVTRKTRGRKKKRGRGGWRGGARRVAAPVNAPVAASPEHELASQPSTGPPSPDPNTTTKETSEPPIEEPVKETPSVTPPPAEEPTSLETSILTDHHYARRLYDAVKSSPNTAPFWDKPDQFMFGMSTYYNIIKKPMWLAEIQRKLNSAIYKSLSEVVSDIRLMLENCLKFWGPNHRLTNVALTLETKLNNAIEMLPLDIQVKCRESFIKEEPRESGILMQEEDSNDSTKDLPNGSCEEKSSKGIPEEDRDISNPDDESLLAWEKSLITDIIKMQISSIWQLPAVGQFLRVSFAALNICEIRQYELERMLLMPKESITLSTLLTSMLSPPSSRSRLDAAVPLMPYEVWNRKLHAKVVEWCEIYNKSNKMETFMACGVDSLFWASMGFSNPYNGDFMDLSFFQRVVILKALCDNLYHSEKHIQELFITELSDSECRDNQLGTMNNQMYFFVPCWPDVRVYKQRIISKSKWETIQEDMAISTKLLTRIAVGSVASEEEEGDLETVLRDFELVADCEEEVKSLAGKGSSAMAVRVAALAKEVSKHKTDLRTSHARAALHRQFLAKLPPFEQEKRKTYWERLDRKNGVQPELFVEGKRQRKERVLPSFLEDVGSDSEDDTDIFEGYDCSEEEESDTEWKPKKKKRKKEPDQKKDEFKEDKSKKKKKKEPEKRPPETVIHPGIKTEPVDNTQKLGVNIKIEKDADDDSSMKKVPSIVTVQSLNKDATSLKGFSNMTLDASNEFSAVHTNVNIKEEVRVPKVEVVEKSQTAVGQSPASVKRPAKTTAPQIRVKQEIIDLSSDEDEPIITPVTTPVKVVGRTVRGSPGSRMPMASPRGMTPSPRGIQASPRGGTPLPRAMPRTPTASPRFSPSLQQRYRTPSPRMTPTGNRVISPRSATAVGNRPQAQRNLQFGNSPRTATPSKPATASPSKPAPPGTIACKILVGKRQNGSYGYIARLEDGGVFDITPEEVNDIRMRNNGGIPNIVYLPRGRLGF